MASYPEEVDVFTVPHSRMKELVNDYAEMIKKTNFTNDVDLTLLLESLLKTFMEFKTHEQIENQFIMKKLKNKLKQLSIKNAAVCNCHNDDQLGQMMNFIKSGYQKKTAQDRINYGLKLEKALEDFTCTFLPHMQEEEEVFQPMLLQYFSYEELIDLKKKVIQQHFAIEQALLQRVAQNCEAKEKCVENREKFQEDEDDSDNYCSDVSSEADPLQKLEEQQPCFMDKVPVELKLRIFSYLKPPDIGRCAKVNHEWKNIAMDAQLWKELYPVQWAQGDWSCGDELDDCQDSERQEENYMVIDDDADEDESSESSVDVECSSIVKQVKKEGEVLRGIVKYILPRVGKTVKKLVLKNSRALTNGILNKMVQACPNLEYLDVSQTRTSDAGLKRIGKNGCGSKLKCLILSGCVNVTDATLVRLAVAQHQSAIQRPLNARDDKMKKLLSCDGGSQVNITSRYKKSENKNDITKDVDHVAEAGRTNVCEEKKGINPYAVNEAESVSRDGDRYDLDCLCQMYYNQCHIAINEGCDIATHKCRKSVKNDGDYSVRNVAATNEREIGNVSKTPIDPGGSNEPENVERKEQINDKNKRKVEQGDQVLANISGSSNSNKAVGGNLAEHAVGAEIEVGLADEVCHSACEATGVGEVQAIEECVGRVTVKRPVVVNEAGGQTAQCDCHCGEVARSVLLNCELEHLNLSGCFQISDIGLGALGKIGQFVKMKHLDLSGCLRLSADSLYTLVGSCPNLQPCQLFYCDNIMDGPFADTASGCQNLECNSRVCCRSGE